ncbi:uncharacterized protein LOC119606980 [Lucilia sericata]|uniref:uncharacterized protein LOC119606980 n=1 Tax=Lucilia sericata TaxID=13632 RepID=UPI0018A825DB|nr:uncharacterized protein LOC119606980 [Lucilia sericata]
MHKLVTVLFLIFAAPMAKGDLNYYVDRNLSFLPNFPDNYVQNATMNIDAYINLNKQQHEQNIHEFDTKIEVFNQSYASSLEIIGIKLDLLIFALAQADEKLNPLSVISEFSRQCVNKYRHMIPKIVDIKSRMVNCINQAVNKMPTLLADVIQIRNYLDNYYKNTFESNILNCQRFYGKYPRNFTLCITHVVADTNTYTIANQKQFGHKIDALECTSDLIIKQTLDCSFDVESDTISAIAEASTLINRCMSGLDDCKQICTGYTCEEVYIMDRSEVDFSSKVIRNPFYGRSDVKNCLMIKIK